MRDYPLSSRNATLSMIRGRTMTAVDFNELYQYALRAQLAYAIAQPGWYITEQLGWRSTSPYRIFIEAVPEVDVNAIVELDDARQVQWIAVRGTDNLTNWLLDLDYAEKSFTQEFAKQNLTIDLHCGFYRASVAVWQAIQPHLHQDYQTGERKKVWGSKFVSGRSTIT